MFTESFFFVLATSIVSYTLGTTLSNGFTFDEKLLFKLQSKLAAGDVCTLGATGKYYEQCSEDCNTMLNCDANGAATPMTTTKCRSYKPYCVKNFFVTACSANFPINHQQCFNYAMNKFMCTSDGTYPGLPMYFIWVDPSEFSPVNFTGHCYPADCTKYHVCNGTSHTIQTCPANNRFWFDEQYDAKGNLAINGDFGCRFKTNQDSCYCYDAFKCDDNGNKYVSRYGDMHYYAYCLELPTISRTALFKCPAGTVHNLGGNSADQVTCVAPT